MMMLYRPLGSAKWLRMVQPIAFYDHFDALLETRLRNFRLRKFRLIGERQCTPKGQARYVNIRGSVQWKGVYMVGDRYWGGGGGKI